MYMGNLSGSMTIFTLYILLLCNLSVSCSSGTYGAAFWCSSASSWMFTAKTERKWSFLPSRTSGAGCWWERKSDFSHKTYRRAPTHMVEVLRRQTVCLFRWRVGPPGSGDAMKHVPHVTNLITTNTEPRIGVQSLTTDQPENQLTHDWTTMGDRVAVSHLYLPATPLV